MRSGSSFLWWGKALLKISQVGWATSFSWWMLIWTSGWLELLPTWAGRWQTLDKEEKKSVNIPECCSCDFQRQGLRPHKSKGNSSPNNWKSKEREGTKQNKPSGMRWGRKGGSNVGQVLFNHSLLSQVCAAAAWGMLSPGVPLMGGQWKRKCCQSLKSESKTGRGIFWGLSSSAYRIDLDFVFKINLNPEGYNVGQHS